MWRFRSNNYSSCKNFNIKKIIAADINKKALQQAKNGADQTVVFSRFGWNYLRKNIFTTKWLLLLEA